MKKQPLKQVLDMLRKDDRFANQIVYWHTIDERQAITAEMPADLHPTLKNALAKKGIKALYSHQKNAYDTSRAGHSFVAVTPTASGKTLCYNLPVLQTISEQPNARALYIFPTKALAQDQKSELAELIDAMEVNIHSSTYDGDTPANVRQRIRKAGHIVLTNPDMLHSGILPHHTKWVSLFENLQYIVIDEVHTYRGVFGSHFANVIRRLKRLCAYYGSSPTFMCTSATIENPKQLTEALTEDTVKLINNNGAPAGKKHFIFYNPPIVQQAMNIRRSATLEVKQLAETFLKEHIQTIVFAKSRVRVEIILTYLQRLAPRVFGANAIQGYRGGYLPTQRRAIEQGLRSGEIYGVVSTNALELGVDIGQLQVCIMTGYPGTIASAWQQAGRAGRRQSEAVVLMVASSSPLDQYVISNPDFFFAMSPETARINPDNVIILMDHIKCAAYELPFRKGDRFGDQDVEDMLDYLTEENVLHAYNGQWHWMSDAFPAHEISLRSASQENIVIIDISFTGSHKVIGEMDRFSAMTLLHEEAIYLHQGVQHQVERLDWEEKKAYVREVNVDYYTDAQLAVSLDVLETNESKDRQGMTIEQGEVSVRAMATLFKKIKFHTHENIGSGPIHLPEMEMHTDSAWISFQEASETMHLQTLEHGLIGIANLLKHVAPLYVMCDPSDVHVIPQMKATHNHMPTIFIYDSYPGGIGLSVKIAKQMDALFSEAIRLMDHCPCQTGCPACVGMDARQNGKDDVRAILSHSRGVHYVTEEKA
ncbi:DEAD/DEAH box helicase [Aureibacillus halotolerans]|uniref:DEAD/DEAH box helicase domain-containing protein n=1 Tax=Aureibacillus halotolerans TaxID=1508390 RepID=A0A4R6U4S4_9BACI|nr:DEAD/DEAH box helicase [Aureibacillus halotolerans]TDQ41480.1 DEAD/DEAH box helicase domain-containing protein [Aureibacillus halotolerans]